MQIKIADVIYENIAQTPIISDLMDMGLSFQNSFSALFFKEELQSGKLTKKKKLPIVVIAAMNNSVNIIAFGRDELQSLKKV